MKSSGRFVSSGAFRPQARSGLLIGLIADDLNYFLRNGPGSGQASG
jgi:hypothetical protein